MSQTKQQPQYRVTTPCDTQDKEFATEEKARDGIGTHEALCDECSQGDCELEPLGDGDDDLDVDYVDHVSDGGTEEVPEFDGRDDRESEPDEVVVDGAPVEDGGESLPDRELTDDPIEWLQKGDGELTTSIKGTVVITKKGFRVLQHRYDISTGSDIVVGPEETAHEFCRVKAWAEMPDGRRAEAHASAHVDRGDDHYLLVSMADTRAKSRALSDVTGVGAVAIEEMVGVDDA
jgi:hypothetical protein